MCRWIAYNGKAIFMSDLVTRPEHSLVAQSLHTEMNFGEDGSLWSTNGDGFGVGWYAEREEPGLFKDVRPAWNDENLHEICSQIKARIFFSHIRAVTAGSVQRANSHPFKHGNWLFQHNGHVHDFPAIKRDLQMDIAPELYPDLKGSTDSETFFYLALTYGLQDDPKAALQKMVERVKKAGRDNGLEKCGLNLSCALSDGKSVYTLRYAVDEKAKTQFYSTNPDCVQDLAGECNVIPDRSVIVVSEPLDDLRHQWLEVPENAFMTVRAGEVTLETFME